MRLAPEARLVALIAVVLWVAPVVLPVSKWRRWPSVVLVVKSTCAEKREPGV